MPYIDKPYYDEDYLGLEIDDEQTFNRYVKRASDMIDQVTNFKINRAGFDKLPDFIQGQVKKAIAAQVEFYQINDGPESLDAGEDFSNYQIGNFSFSKGGRSESKQAERVSPAAIDYLRTTGLLHSGLGVVEHVYY
ncbi:hypothetical protein [Alkalibacillus almallahensis]|uniref:hypothetical protein n=1 Tax=Alkalibacillus almallahensis TaxID=1379154 RepID=UPI00141E89E1|nr:hypothetical protein [Alkalibacillus almallahensis]NIK12869.1 hypothetical protein [Alkalibacillus almallahensis]